MSKYEKQQELLVQLKVENKQLLQFKKLNNLMRDTLENFVTTEHTSSPFKLLFDLLEQELQADVQAIVARNDNGTSFSVLATTDSRLQQRHCPTNEQSEVSAQTDLFSQAAIFFNVNLSPKWPDALKELIPEATSAVIQPVRIGQHRYAIILMSAHSNRFSSETKAILASYSSFIASFLSLFENQRLASERDRLFAQQKRIEQSMTKQDKLAAIGQLAAGVAHELNNPLGFIYSNLNTFNVYINTLRTFIEQAVATAPNLKEQAQSCNLDFILEDSLALIDESLTGARRSRDIINNLRTFSHPDDTTVSTIDIVSLLENTLRIANTQIKRQAHLTLQKHITSAFVNGNATQLSQVMLNLINNAYQAIQHNEGKITVSVERLERWITIKVEDNGSGIRDSDIAHIFEPFFTTKDIGQGTGLGLSISRAITEQHGGCLALEHTNAAGTLFVVSLPEMAVSNNA